MEQRGKKPKGSLSGSIQSAKMNGRASLTLIDHQRSINKGEGGTREMAKYSITVDSFSVLKDLKLRTMAIIVYRLVPAPLAPLPPPAFPSECF